MLTFNERSFFCNDAVRVINYILLVISGLLILGIKFDFSAGMIASIVIGGLIYAGIITDFAVSKTSFGTTVIEERRRGNFKLSYFIVCAFFSLIMALYAIVLVKSYMNGDILWRWVIAPTVVCFINTLQIPNLHFWIFKDDLMY